MKLSRIKNKLFIIRKESVHQEAITNVNTYIPNSRTSKYLNCSTWAQPQKWQNDLSSFPRQIIQHHSNPSLHPKHWGQKSWSWPVLWKCPRPSRTNTKKDVLFIIGNWNAKAGSQEISGVTSKCDLRNTLVIVNILFQQHKRQLYIQTSPDSQHQN